MAQHLIEVDAVQMKSDNKMFIRETLIFRNIGTKDFYGSLRTWLPDGGENIKLSRSELQTGAGLIALDFEKNGNIISWKDYVEQNNKLPVLYIIEYTIAMESGASSIIGIYTKKLSVPMLINYRYIEKPGLSSLVIKITKPQGNTVKFIDENKKDITLEEVDESGDIIRFSSPQFKEINVVLTKTQTPSSMLTQTLTVTAAEPNTTIESALYGGAFYSANDLFSEGMKYFSVILLMSLVLLGAVFYYEKIDKNKLKFITDLKTKFWYIYYFALIGNSIIGIIWLIMTLTVSFKELPLNFDQGKFFFASVIFFLSISSLILAVSLLKSRPVIKLNGLHFIISLLIGLLSLFVKLTDPQNSMPYFIPVLLLMSSAISIWYHRIAVFKHSSHELLMEQEDAEVSIPMINIKRGYSVLPNNDIKFGIRLTNETGYTITNVDTILDYSEELFNIKDSKIQSISNITPNNTRTATYLLKPLGCIHNEQINALITYKDHTGKKQTLHMRPKEVHCVCPFLKEKPMSEGEYSRLAAGSEFVQEGISFKGISVEELAKFMCETCRHMLHKVREYDLEGKKVIYLSGDSIGEKAYYLLTAVIQDYKGLTQVVLRAHSDKKYGLNGFMNEMADSLRHLVGSVQNAKEIGIIENTKVINIIDSVVQRTSFNMGEGGNSQVNIKDSVVQRSKIGKEE
jgi:hypothetical protein